MTKFLMSSDPHSLRAALSEYDRTATVEAEFGNDLVEGTEVTLAHHGHRAGNPCPCLHDGEVDVEAIGLSHLDLDAIGGALAILGAKPEALSFWELAAFVDVSGPHRLAEANASDVDLARLHAWWAWSEANRCFPNRDGSVDDVTGYVESAREALHSILDGDDDLLRQGREWKAVQDELNQGSFVEYWKVAGIVVRVAPRFVNHLYTTPDGLHGRCVVAYNTITGSITISMANLDGPGLNCREIVQSLWGAEAGGHAGIAGSPRGMRMRLHDLRQAVREARVALSSPSDSDGFSLGYPLYDCEGAEEE